MADEFQSGYGSIAVAETVTIGGTGYAVTTVNLGSTCPDVTDLVIPSYVEIGRTSFTCLPSLVSIDAYGEGSLASVDGVLFDGDVLVPVNTGDYVDIRRSEKTVSILKISRISFLEVLRNKMRAN